MTPWFTRFSPSRPTLLLLIHQHQHSSMMIHQHSKRIDSDVVEEYPPCNKAQANVISSVATWFLPS